MELAISIIGAIAAIFVSVIGALFANHKVIALQTRKLKEQYYFNYISALHNYLANSHDKSIYEDFIKARDILINIASVNVVNKLIDLENKGFFNLEEPPSKETQDHYLTELIKAIRKDLKINNKNFPTNISFNPFLINTL
jgi:hypothetical protein